MDGIVFEHVYKAFGGKQVLQDISFTINTGECFTILGPSGCGKTVILRLIAGFEVPNSGKIMINGQTVADGEAGFSLPPEERKLGVVFQDYAVWPHKTVKQNIAYPLEMQNVPAEERAVRIQKAVDLVNLSGLENRFPYQLSGGQQQRVALARAVVSESALLLLDEPLTNLDANLREEMRFEIKALQKKINGTVLYVTHDQEVALAISDRLAVMDSAGQFCQIGNPEQVFEQPATPFCCEFLGTAYFLPCTVQNGTTVLSRTGEQFLPVSDEYAHLKQENEVLAAFRPMDVILSRTEGLLKGTVTRTSLLGPIIDYSISLGGIPVRAQLQTEEAVRNNTLFKENETCFCSFDHIVWFAQPHSEAEGA